MAFIATVKIFAVILIKSSQKNREQKRCRLDSKEIKCADIGYYTLCKLYNNTNARSVYLSFTKQKDANLHSSIVK
jgi:hypothetical protein